MRSSKRGAEEVNSSDSPMRKCRKCREEPPCWKPGSGVLAEEVWSPGGKDGGRRFETNYDQVAEQQVTGAEGKGKRCDRLCVQGRMGKAGRSV